MYTIEDQIAHYCKLEHNFIKPLNTWQVSQLFPDEQSLARKLIKKLKEETSLYRVWMRFYPKITKAVMSCDPLVIRINELEKYLQYTKKSKNIDKRREWMEVVQKAKAVPIEDIYSFEKLKRGRTRSSAICPLHGEKTGSFIIYHQSNSYSCFGCHCAGDSIDFVMRLYGITFKEAVRKLVNN